MNRKSTLDEFIIHLEKRIEDEDFRNSVEKITFMTTLHVIKKIWVKSKEYYFNLIRDTSLNPVT
jgi:ribosome biogenesis protein Nip4